MSRVPRCARAILLCLTISTPGVTSCAVLEDAGAGYPQSITTDRDSLIRSWESGESRLTLKGDGTFDSKGIDLGDIECQPASPPDPGAGSWDSFDTGQGSTRVSLKFGSACFGSLWVGQLDGVTVLWRETSEKKHEFTSLK